MRSTIIGTIACLTMCAAASPAAHAASVSPGKKIALASAPIFGPVPAGDGFVAAVQIVKAKKKHVITIEGMLTTFGAPSVQALQLRAVVVSNVSFSSASAQGGVVTLDCTGSYLTGTCSVSGNWWVDIDALETGEPGAWANQLVDVVLFGGTLPDPGSSGSGWYSLTARLEKK